MPRVSLADARAPFVVALDAGTSSVRALAYDAEGRDILQSEEQIRYVLATTAEGGATFGADELFDTTVRAIDGVVNRLSSRAGDVAAVGTTSFWHSLMGIDATGKAVTPVFYWADTRSAGWASRLRAEMDAEAVWQRTGCRLHSSYWPAKLCWLRETEPDTVARASRWLSFAEFALGRFCEPSAAAVTICMASGTGLLDVHALDWDSEMLAASGISSDDLSPLVDLGPPGRLRREFAARWPALASADWFPALGDGACANVGSGAIGAASIALTIGTSAAERVILPRPKDEAWTIPPGLWAYRLDREHAVLGGALSNGGNLLRWIWNTTGAGPDDEATAAAAALAPDSTGLTVLPFLAGERSPGWHDDATAVFAGLTAATRPEHLIRAGMESVAYRLAAVHDALGPLCADDHRIIVSGGAVLGMPSWLRIVADTLGRPLTALAPDDETTARGAALIAATEAGILPTIASAADFTESAALYEPDQSAHERYRAGRDRQSRLESVLVATGEFV